MPREEKRFTVGKWGEFTQWKCAYCPFDTLEGEAAMLEHYHRVHAPVLAKAVRKPETRDRFGNLNKEA
jgi:hypothetical protein